MNKNEYSQELRYAVDAALNAGKYLLKNKSKLNLKIDSDPKDTKLKADIEAENLIKQFCDVEGIDVESAFEEAM